jgi:CheY-like chemotaxis protein
MKSRDQNRAFVRTNHKLAQFSTPYQVFWKPEFMAEAALDARKTLKLTAEPVQPITGRDLLELPNQVTRTRYKLGMQRAQSFQDKLIEEDLSNSASLSQASSPLIDISHEDIAEDVIVSRVPFVELPPVLSRIQSKRSVASKSVSAVKYISSHSSSMSPYKVRVLSKRNPFNSSEGVASRSNIKRFLFPPSQDLSKLSIELGPPKVLLVEDNSILRDSLYTSLTEACCWEPDLAHDGAEALKKYQDYAALGYRYTVIFMDTTMPEMDGYTATERIRALELSSSCTATLIIGLLGNFEPEAEARCVKAGMNSISNLHSVFKDTRANDFKVLIQGIQSGVSLNVKRSPGDALHSSSQ